MSASVNGSTNFQPRFGGSATLHNLADKRRSGSGMRATIENVTGKTMQLRCESFVDAGAPVRLEVDGGIVLGSVMGAERKPDHHLAIIAIETVAPVASDLARLAQHLVARPPAADTPRAGLWAQDAHGRLNL